MKKKLLQYGICFAIGMLVAIWVMDTEGLFLISGNTAETLSILCDSFFIPGIVLTSVGSLIWISSTGFFDAFGYVASLVGHMFVPFKKTTNKSYYDYKLEKEEKRGRAIYFILITGVFFLLVAAAFMVAWMNY